MRYYQTYELVIIGHEIIAVKVRLSYNERLSCLHLHVTKHVEMLNGVPSG